MMKKILIAFIVLASSSLFISCDKPENQTSDNYLDEVINRAGRVIRDKKITSTSLGKDMNYNVILPPGYSEKKEFPFFYLLHGAGDNHNAWLDKGNAEAILKGYLKDGGKPMIVVVPDEATNFWIKEYDDFFHGELIPAVEKGVLEAMASGPLAGCVVENVGTVVAIADAVEKGEALLSRVTTVSGDVVTEPKNILAPLGTKYSDLVEFCGGTKEPPVKVLSGGTMMGFAVSSLDIATTKTTSGLLFLSKRRVFQYTSEACINCGRCLRACPMNLNPADISKAVEADDIADAERAHVMTCIECGACSFVCPAHRTITQFCRRAKNSIRARIAAEKAKAAAAAAKSKEQESLLILIADCRSKGWGIIRQGWDRDRR